MLSDLKTAFTFTPALTALWPSSSVSTLDATQDSKRNMCKEPVHSNNGEQSHDDDDDDLQAARYDVIHMG